MAVNDVINFKIYLQTTSKAMADREKKRKTEIQESEYLGNEKSFLDEIKKTFFVVFGRLSSSGK